jgi:hypothetical protein
MAASVLGHEAVHGASYILKLSDWRSYMPSWACNYPREESQAFIVERIIFTGMQLAQREAYNVVNPKRPIAGLKL